MKNRVHKILANRSTRILVIFYALILSLTGFFVILNYLSQKRQTAETISTYLKTVVKSASSQLNGDELDELLKRHPEKNSIRTIREDTNYLSLHKILYTIDSVQNLESPLYILVYNRERRVFQYVARSDNNVYYLNDYQKFPKELKLNYKKGGFLPHYQSENGSWLSAFEPIRNNKNRVVGVVEADFNTKMYFDRIRKNFFWMLGYSLFGVIVITIVLIPVVQKILRKEELNVKKLLMQKETIELYSNEVQASSRYASSIQEALVRPIKCEGIIENVQFLNEPRDIVSGDFRWSTETENFVYFALGDCTGHGIPGAVLSCIGATILNGFFALKTDFLPDEILTKLDQLFSEYINLSSDQLLTDGMDVGIIRIDKKTSEISYSGALQDLVCFQNGKSQVIKANRFPIGASKYYPNKIFRTESLHVTGKVDLFLYSDGFQHQFGGLQGKKMGAKKFLSILENSLEFTGKNRISYIEKQVKDYQLYEFQVDDRLLLSLELRIEK